jgi:CRP-like cAMP-binding protein
MTWLRIFVIASAVVAICYIFFWLRDPVGVFWETMLMLVSVFMLLLTHWKNIRAKFNSEEILFIKYRFPELSKADARKLLDSGKWIEAEKGTQLTVQGAPVSHLYYISQGGVDIFVDDHKIAVCGEGNFVGEMSILTDEPASGTAVLNRTLHYWGIEKSVLMDMVKANPAIAKELDASFSRNYRDKLLLSNKYLQAELKKNQTA